MFCSLEGTPLQLKGPSKKHQAKVDEIKKEAKQAFKEGKLEMFDAHAKDSMCHIRAFQVILLKEKDTLTKNEIDFLTAAYFLTKFKTFNRTHNRDEFALKKLKDECGLGRNFLTTRLPKAIRLHSHKFIENQAKGLSFEGDGFEKESDKFFFTVYTVFKRAMEKQIPFHLKVRQRQEQNDWSDPESFEHIGKIPNRPHIVIEGYTTKKITPELKEKIQKVSLETLLCCNAAHHGQSLGNRDDFKLQFKVMDLKDAQKKGCKDLVDLAIAEGFARQKDALFCIEHIFASRGEEHE